MIANLKRATIKQAESDGAIYFDDSAIIHRRPSGDTLSVSISDVAVVGEFTTPDGPGVDWYLVLVLRGSDHWHQFSMYAEGTETLCDKFSKFWNSRVQVGLANRTDLASRIMWPPELVGRPLFVFAPFREGNVLRRVISSILGETSFRLSAEALSAAGLDA